MKPIEITVRDKVARLVDPDAFIVCGNSKYTVSFEFDAEWDEYNAKTACFKWNGLKEEVPFTGSQCKVPIISNTVSVEIGVFAGDLQTTTGALVNAKKSVLCGTEIHHEPSPDVYNQLMGLFEELKISGVTPEQIELAVAEYFAENPSAAGEDGKSAYQIWLEAGNEGTEADFLESLKGADGEDGSPGQDGQPGADGQDGKPGADGKPGITPHVGDNGNWWIGEVDTGVKAQGDKGESPTITVTQGGLSDGRGAVFITIKNADGTEEEVTLLDGLPGKDGQSPTIWTEEIENGYGITISNGAGAQQEYIEIHNGDDYVLTDSDKSEIAEIVASLNGGTGSGSSPGSGSGSGDVFVAEYGVTTFAEVLEAYNAGKIPAAVNSDYGYWANLVLYDYDVFQFAFARGNVVRMYSLHEDDRWAETETRLARESAGLPEVTDDDEEKVLTVVSGQPAWTDKTGIVNAVLAALPTWEGGSY